MAQRKRAGLITRRSLDRNEVLLHRFESTFGQFLIFCKMSVTQIIFFSLFFEYRILTKITKK